MISHVGEKATFKWSEVEQKYIITLSDMDRIALLPIPPIETRLTADEIPSVVVLLEIMGYEVKVEWKKNDKVNCLRCGTPLLTETEVKKKIPAGQWIGTTEDLAKLNRIRDTIGVTCAVCGKSFCSACMEKYGKPHPRSGGIACLECGGHLKEFIG